MQLQTKRIIAFMLAITLIPGILEALPRTERSAPSGNGNTSNQLANPNSNCPSVVNNIIFNGTGSPGPHGPPGPQGPPGIASPQGQTTGGGLTYTRWGRSSCPSTPGTELLYDGIMAGSQYTQGGGANHLCLPKEEPEFLEYRAGQQNARASLNGVEYELYDGLEPSGFRGDQHYNAPCAVCFTHDRSITVMIPAKVNCPSAWTREYYGYVMAGMKTPRYRSMFVCVDVNADRVPGTGANTNPGTLYFTETSCNGIPCGPYEDGKEIPCVVCTK